MSCSQKSRRVRIGVARPDRARILPRMLSADEAALYLGYDTTGLLANIPVRPVQMAATGPGCQPKYDRHALDAWLDTLSGLSVPGAAPPAAQEDPAEAEFATWRARRAGGGH